MSNINVNIPKSSVNKILIIVVAILVVVMIYFAFFSGDDRYDSDIKNKEDRIKELLEASDEHKRIADSLESRIIHYQDVAKEYRERDSLKLIEIEKQKEVTKHLKEEQLIAKRERERVEEELRDFKNNPPKYDLDDPYPLLIDTRKKLDNDE